MSVKPYQLTNELRKGKEERRYPWAEIRDNGDFRRTIDFFITGPAPLNGIIFQLIVKKTNATIVLKDGVEEELTTSERIAAVTSNNVKYMCDSYIEYFEVDADGTTDGDQFGNGAIALYDGIYPQLNRKKNISKGTILQSGTAVFIPEGPMTKKIRSYKWNFNLDTPANGLPYMDYNKAVWQEILSAAQSNTLVQTINLTWGYKADAKGKCIDCSPPIPSKGGKRKTRKTRGCSRSKHITYMKK
jgi:hypothetical protein